ncbi:MAG: CheR family methyltransferase [Acidimicrobiales bacterium]
MSVAADHFRYVRDLVLERSAISLTDDKHYLVEARLAPIAQSIGVDGVDSVVEQLRARRDPALEERVVEAMTTNETSWFRDRRPFDALSRYVLPELIRRKTAEHSLRLWSAACSSGQELYSVAMLLLEHFPELHSGWYIDLLGSDLSNEMVERAAKGRFSTLEVNRGLPASLLVRYFYQEGTSWVAGPELKAWARFMKLNLVGPWPALPSFDVVMLRNVLIYFDLDARRQVLQRAVRQLAPGGFLFLGSAESATGLVDGLEAVTAEGALFYRRAGGRQ